MGENCEGVRRCRCRCGEGTFSINARNGKIYCKDCSHQQWMSRDDEARTKKAIITKFEKGGSDFIHK